MKKIICCILLLCVIFSFPSCNNYEIADSFIENKIENGYNNFLAGGSLCLVNGKLYSYNLNALVNKKAIVITPEKSVEMLSQKNQAFLGIITRFYQYDNAIYSFNDNSERLYQYNFIDKKFVKSNLKIKKCLDYYLDNDLFVYYADNDKLCIRYKDKEKILDLNVYRFFLMGKTIYLLTDEGSLYTYDLLSPKNNCKYLTELADDAVGDVFTVCYNYIYYVNYNNDKNTNELWKYSLIDKTKKRIVDKNVKSVNMYDKSFYYIVDNNLYVDSVKGNPQKVTDVSADEIYIFGDKWIYLKDLDGRIYRSTHDGKITEKVFG